MVLRKAGRITGRNRLIFFITGMGATLWFLFRVIPKPSRAAYPCMRAAAPVMSSFLVYMIGLSASAISLKLLGRTLRRSRYMTGTLLILATVLSVGVMVLPGKKDVLAGILNPVDNSFPVNSNEPVGMARGLHPGRVVWVHDPRATNENYKTDGSTGYWYEDLNVDEQVVKNMLASSLMKYAGTEDVQAAWDSVFRFFNASHGHGDAGYTVGEKIAFKINLTNQSIQWGGGNRYSRMDATPQLLNAILDQLINVVGVAPGDITMGDPYREFRLEYRTLVKNKFPGVRFVDGAGGSGVLQTVPSSGEELVFSDGLFKSTLPQQYLDATYVINMPCLKTHNEGGITLIAKNHQGSFLKLGDPPQGQSAMDMHYSLPANSPGSGQYRHTVDYMGHVQTGGKALIYIIDGIWAGENWTGHISKFKSQPFGNDYCSSLLVGQDPVALESVGYDILFQEYVEDGNKAPYPISMKTEIADHLLQCASHDYWPSGFYYDPEHDGWPLESLGVFEHWNNPTDRQYSRNLGTGEGIELLYYNLETGTGTTPPPVETTHLAFPNPFMSSTTIRKPGGIQGEASLEIYDMRGCLVRQLVFGREAEVVWQGDLQDGDPAPGGMYLYTIRAPGQAQRYSGKLVLKR